MKRQTIVLLVFSFLLIGMVGGYNEEYGKILTLIMLFLWTMYFIDSVKQKKSKSQTVSEEQNFVYQNPSSVTTQSASLAETAVSSQSSDSSEVLTNRNLQRSGWVRVVGLINALLLIFGFQYVAIAPIATFIGLAFSGQDAGYVLLLFIISGTGSICFVAFGVYSVVLAFGKKYNDNFSRTSKIIMFMPLISLIFAGVFVGDLVLRSSNILPQKEETIYVGEEKIPLSQFQTEFRTDGLRPYAIKGNQVYVHRCFDCWSTKYELIPDASAPTFSVLGDRYARDVNHLYFNGKIIPNADPSTFEMIESGTFGQSIWRDKDHLFIGTHALSDNPSSFKSFLNSRDYKYFAVDQSVYLWGKVIVGADRNTFRVINPSFSADETHVFCAERTVEGADPKTFVTFETKDVTGDSVAVYGKDSTYAYFCSPYAGRRIVRIEEVDVASFDATGMKLGHAKDKYRDYYFSGVSYEQEKTPYKVTIY